MIYTPPEPVQIDKHIPTGVVIRGYKAEHLHAAFIAGAASRDVEVESLKADAERYRWLKNESSRFIWTPSRFNAAIISGFSHDGTGYLGYDFESAIDAARSK